MGSGGKDNADKTKKKPGRRPTACAECRRLKFRCDRNVPCQKCTSRGCGSICPDGVLTPGKGNRLILANTEELHDQIEQLCSRNRELENALRVMQENVSDQPHPLLRTDILIMPPPQPDSSSAPSTSSSSKSPPTTSRVSPITHPPASTEASLEEDHNNIDAFGTLVIGQQGASSFFGKVARAEYLIRARHMSHRESKQPLPPLPHRLVKSSFLEVRTVDESLVSETLNHLPSLQEAVRLCDIYSEYGKFIYSPIPRPELNDQVFGTVYQAKPFNSSEYFHALSLLFIIFAIATFFDTNAQPYSTQAQIYYHLSRTALSFAPPYRETTLASIQTLIHMALYLDLSDSGSPDSAWMYIGHAVRLGYSIGLHLSSVRWKLTNQEIRRRSHVFWQLSVLDTWSSIYLGRPPGLLMAFVDQPLPDATFHSEDLMTSNENIMHSWLIHYTSLLHSSLDIILGRRQPNYSQILDFDRKIRDFDVPISWRMLPEDESLPRPHRDVHMYRWLALSSKEIILLNLHRPYFAQALQESPADLRRHRYLPSVVAAYRSAWRLSRALAMTWMAVPSILARLFLPWSHALSAATIMCILVTRAPTTHLTTPALEDLDNLTSLFDSASSTCQPALDLLRFVQTLRQQAHEVIGTRYYHHTNEDSFTLADLDRLNGKTSLFADDHHDHHSLLATSSSSSSTNLPISSRSRATSATISDSAETYLPLFHTIDNLHPTLAQDLQEFGIRSSTTTSSISSMTFHDLHRDRTSSSSNDHSPPPPQVVRPTPSPPQVPKLFLQSRLDPPPLPLPPPSSQMPFFHQPYHVVETLIESRRMTYGSGFGGGYGGNFGHMQSIVLDPVWHGLAEQLGF